MTALRILELVIGIGFAIVLHEFGHFIAARLAKIRVLKFSIGFPPRLFGFKSGHTEYVVQATPLGGYVKMSGEEWEETGKLKPYDLMAKPWHTRIGVYVAGVAMNLLLAWALFFGVLVHGLDLGTYPPVVGEVAGGGAAARAGVRPGDRVESVNGTAVANWYEIYSELDRAGEGKEATIRVSRDGGHRSLRLHVDADPGFQPRVEPVVGSVVPMDRADKAGFKAGDRVVAIGRRDIGNWTEMSSAISNAPEKPLAVRVRRGGALVDLTVTPRRDPGLKRSFIGISSAAPMTVVRRFSLAECAKLSSLEAFLIAREIPRALWKVATGQQRLKDVLGGPVMIVRLGMAKAEQGIWDFLHFLGVLNISLLVVNLLPIPAVDGGMIVLAFLEGLRRRRFSMAVYARLQQFGVALLMALVAFTLFNDLAR